MSARMLPDEEIGLGAKEGEVGIEKECLSTVGGREVWLVTTVLVAVVSGSVLAARTDRAEMMERGMFEEGEVEVEVVAI